MERIMTKKQIKKIFTERMKRAREQARKRKKTGKRKGENIVFSFFYKNK